MKILFCGDVYGELGRKVLEENLEQIRKDEKINVVIVNGENASHGKGITRKIYKQFMEMGVNVVTMGNHTFDNPQIKEFIDEADKMCIPCNYPSNFPGKRYVTFKYNTKTITVINMLGQVYMNSAMYPPVDTIDRILSEVKSDIIFVDFHAEATSEKISLGYYLDGRVTAVVGTHTHVPTCDDRVLPKGTAYQTDVGMIGALDGVIGVNQEIGLYKFRTNMPTKFQPMEEGMKQFNALVIDINDTTNKATAVKRINLKY